MLTHLLGTEFFPNMSDGILFVEDIAEHPYRVERMMLQLHFADVLNKQKAIVFGDFSAYKLASFDNAYNFDEMIKYLRETLAVPVITGLPFGHIKDKVTLVIKIYCSENKMPNRKIGHFLLVLNTKLTQNYRKIN